MLFPKGKDRGLLCANREFELNSMKDSSVIFLKNGKKIFQLNKAKLSVLENSKKIETNFIRFLDTENSFPLSIFCVGHIFASAEFKIDKDFHQTLDKTFQISKIFPVLQPLQNHHKSSGLQTK